MSSEKKDEPAKLHTNLLTLPPQISSVFQITVTFFLKLCVIAFWLTAEKKRRGWPNKWQSVIVTQNLNSLGSSISFLTVVLSVPMAR